MKRRVEQTSSLVGQLAKELATMGRDDVISAALDLLEAWETEVVARGDKDTAQSSLRISRELRSHVLAFMPTNRSAWWTFIMGGTSISGSVQFRSEDGSDGLDTRVETASNSMQWVHTAAWLPKTFDNQAYGLVNVLRSFLLNDKDIAEQLKRVK